MEQRGILELNPVRTEPAGRLLDWLPEGIPTAWWGKRECRPMETKAR